jgi:hypothetical protein
MSEKVIALIKGLSVDLSDKSVLRLGLVPNSEYVSIIITALDGTEQRLLMTREVMDAIGDLYVEQVDAEDEAAAIADAAREAATAVKQ